MLIHHTVWYFFGDHQNTFELELTFTYDTCLLLGSWMEHDVAMPNMRPLVLVLVLISVSLLLEIAYKACKDADNITTTTRTSSALSRLQES